MIAGWDGLLLALQLEEYMLSGRHISDHKVRINLQFSLRKQRELSNRINVLMAEKERRLKDIQKRVEHLHEEQQLRAEKAMRREELERSIQQERRAEQNNNELAKGLRRDLSLGLSVRQGLLLETKRSWYREIKQQSQTNLARITHFKQRQLQAHKNSSKRIRLMEAHGKENVKQYWKERGQYIQQSRLKESQKNSQLFENSLNNISLLEQREQRLLREIRETLEIEPIMIINLEENQPSSTALPPLQSASN